MPKPSSSIDVVDRPVPNSTRPFDMMSSTAACSASLMGWLKLKGSKRTPWEMRICFVRCDTAPKNTSGAELWEYSSRKWCSTSHT